MSAETEKLDEIFRQLPEDLRNELIAFAESLLRRNGSNNRENPENSVRSLFGSWDSGDPHSADNDRIDSDLADEYENSHIPSK
jgi:hypothetical protein